MKRHTLTANLTREEILSVLPMLTVFGYQMSHPVMKSAFIKLIKPMRLEWTEAEKDKMITETARLIKMQEWALKQNSIEEVMEKQAELAEITAGIIPFHKWHEHYLKLQKEKEPGSKVILNYLENSEQKEPSKRRTRKHL